MDNKQFAAGLRELAEFYETHPEMPQPQVYPTVYTYDKSDFVAAVKVMTRGGTVEKRTDEGNGGLFYHHAVRRFGALELTVNIPKSLVCRKVQEERWECPDSLLEPEPEAENVA